MIHFWSRNFKFPRFVYHSTLDSRVWADDKTIKPMVHDALLLAAGNFINYLQALGFPITESDIVDVFIHGSVADFFYDNTSNIDICIVADWNTMAMKFPGMNLKQVIFAVKNDWRRKFKLSICGRGFDINMMDVNIQPFFDGQYKSGPIYSVLHNQWRREPILLTRPQVKQLRRGARKKFRGWRKIYKRICHDNMGADFIDMFLNRISDERLYTVKNTPTAPISESVLAFRMMRMCGYVRDLRIRAQKYRAQNFNVTA